MKHDGSHKDLMINVGGPVWAMDWCPRSTTDEGNNLLITSVNYCFIIFADLVLYDIENLLLMIIFSCIIAEQYLAVGAYNSDEYHVFSKPYSGKHIIQIWSLSKLVKGGAPNKPHLALGIAHEGGFVWDLQWCPKGSPLKQKVSGKCT